MGLFIAALVLSFVFAVNADDTERIIREKCLNDNGITREEYMESMSHTAKDVDVKIKCAAMCIMKGHDFITKDGTLDIEQVIKGFRRNGSYPGSNREHIYRSVMDACAKDKINDCESAYNFLECMDQKFTENYSKQ